MVILNYKKEILVYDLHKSELLSTLQMPNHIKHIICSNYKPILLVYGDSGFIEIYLALTGDLINRIGPFGIIEGVFFDENRDSIAIFNANMKVTILNIKLDISEDRDTILTNVMRPVIVNTFNHEVLPMEPDNESLAVVNSLKLVMTQYMRARRDRELKTLEKMAEEIKKDQNIVN